MSTAHWGGGGEATGLFCRDPPSPPRGQPRARDPPVRTPHPAQDQRRGAAAGPFAGLVAAPAAARTPPDAAALVPIPDRRDGEVRLHLPKGFSYRSFHDTEPTVVLPTAPPCPAGTTAWARSTGRAAASSWSATTRSTAPAARSAPGRRTTRWPAAARPRSRSRRTGEVIRAFTSLNGTMMNCSGGRMPWGSWVTCEETVNGPDVGPDFTGASNVPLTKPHGYVFEVPASHLAAGASRRGSRSRTPAGSPTRPCRSTRRAATSTSPRTTSVPVRLLPLPPAARPDEGRAAPRRRQAADAAGQGRRQRPAGRQPGRRRDVRRRLGRHRRARRRVRLHAGPDRAHPQRHRTGRTSAARAGTRVRRSSRGSRARSTTAASSTSPRPRAAARPRPATADPVAGYGNGSGQVWAYDAKRRRSSPGLPVAGPRRRSTCPTTSPRPSTARWWSARTTSTTTSSAA